MEKKNAEKVSQELIPLLDSNNTPIDFYFTDKSSGIIYYRRRMGGKRVKFSCKTRNLRNAKIYANRKLKEIYGADDKFQSRILEDYIRDFRNLRQKQYETGEDKYNTWKNVRNAIDDFAPYWGAKTTLDINTHGWASFIDWWEVNKKGKQIENVVKYFRVFCNYLASEIDPNTHRPLIPMVPKIKDPWRRQVSANRKKKKERVITPGEFRTILDACEAFTEPKDQIEIPIILKLMYLMAFRLEEAAGLKWENLRLDAKVPYYKFSEDDNKAGLDARCPIHEIVLLDLHEFENELGQGDYVFPQLRDPNKPRWGKSINWSKLRREADLDFHWTAHTFRHSCLTELFNNPEVSDSLVIKCYRISWVEALRTYIHVTDEGMKKIANAKRI